MRVLVVEDEELIVEFLKRSLKIEKHDVDVASDGLKGYKKALKAHYDVIILDVMLPMKNGLDICRELRRTGVATPILFLSARNSEAARIQGLDAGADDYLVKPFSYRELNARLRAITRRPSVVPQSELQIANLILNPVSRDVTRGGKLIHLRPKEYALLEYMMRHPNVALPRYELLRNVWGISNDMTSNRLEVYIRHLRNKVDSKYRTKLIHTVRGVGYKISG